MFILLILLFVITTIFTVMSKGRFIKPANMRNILNSMIIATFLTTGAVCLMISGQIDLSTASVGTMTGIIVASLVTTLGIPWPIAVIMSLVCSGGIGFLNAVLINEFGFQAFIATMAVANIAKGLAYLICDTKAIPINDPALLWIGTGRVIFDRIPVSVILALLTLFVYGVILAKTKFGQSIYMIGGNPQAARLSGLKPRKMSYILFINNGVLGGAAGILTAARMKSGNVGGVSASQFAGMTGAILGGVSFGGGSGGMGGAFIGLVVLNGFSNGLTTVGVSSFWQTVASGALLLIALAFDLVGRKKLGTVS
jgi:ribose/xylose/arabinose/galactoside ABC-type transport system permease subunit